MWWFSISVIVQTNGWNVAYVNRERFCAEWNFIPKPLRSASSKIKTEWNILWLWNLHENRWNLRKVRNLREKKTTSKYSHVCECTKANPFANLGFLRFCVVFYFSFELIGLNDSEIALFSVKHIQTTGIQPNTTIQWQKKNTKREKERKNGI